MKRLMLILVLVLVACGGEEEGSPAANTVAPTRTPTDVPPCPPGYPGCQLVRGASQWSPVEQTFEDGITMVMVPAGCFWMGAAGSQDEDPLHQVCFRDPFWLDKTEITNAQFEGLNGQAEESSTWGQAEHPRETIDWYEAQAFCELRGGRLPTEAEWEYAARSSDSRFYPWGNAFTPDNVVYSGNSSASTAPVGSRPIGVSWVGALDMSGNVAEWVSTIYEGFRYPYNGEDGREDAENDAARVVRGGSWETSTSDGLRAGDRDQAMPSARVGTIGLRCVRTYE